MNYIRKYKYVCLGGLIIGMIIMMMAFVKSDVYASDYSSAIISTDEAINYFYVDIKGAINNPGVYAFTDGDMIINAIEEAGGLTKNADTSLINLSKKLHSEMVIYVYTKNEVKKLNTTPSSIASTSNTTYSSCLSPNNTVSNNQDSPSNEVISGKVNLNTAGVEELMILSGIGEAKALAIIAYRETQGCFTSIEDLMNVSGIGQATFDKIKDQLTV